jgi:hypothetical protein
MKRFIFVAVPMLSSRVLGQYFGEIKSQRRPNLDATASLSPRLRIECVLVPKGKYIIFNRLYVFCLLVYDRMRE